MVNAWISHLKAFRKAHKGMSLGDAMKAASASYKKTSGIVGKVIGSTKKRKKKRKSKSKSKSKPKPKRKSKRKSKRKRKRKK
tara:strand:- start:2402 stop:2647 length:246 start_codon:yes stop_codon:yes gene_type:complete